MHRLVAAVAEHMAPDGVIKGAGGGDGGLFNGVTARYLALVVTTLPRSGPRTRRPATPPARCVLESARVRMGQPANGGRPAVVRRVLGPRRRDARPAAGKDAQFVEGAVNASAIPERDLSVQLSGWMLMEAAHATAAGDGSDTAGDGSDTAGDGSDTAGDESDIMDGGDAVQ